MNLEKKVMSLTGSFLKYLYPLRVGLGWVQPPDCVMFVQERKSSLKKRKQISALLSFVF